MLAGDLDGSALAREGAETRGSGRWRREVWSGLPWRYEER